jgi:zinc/manganese transport system substrate-binding protein
MSSLVRNLLLAGVFYGTSVHAANSSTLKVASLSTVLADWTRQVGGDRVEVVEIVKPDTDPHLFEPGPGDIRAISKARLVLANGLGFESYLDKLKKGVGDGPTFVVVGDAIKPLMVEEACEHEEHEGHSHTHTHAADGKVPDPHWWHSIGNAKVAVREIRDALILADPANTDLYKTNAAKALSSLDELNRWAKLEIARVPRSQRLLVTSHDALGYFARDFGFEILPVQGFSTSDQPSSQKVRELIGVIKAKGVKSLFAENIENPKVLEEITRETGAKVGGVLYADGLGKGSASTYDGMMRHNISTICQALE